MTLHKSNQSDLTIKNLSDWKGFGPALPYAAMGVAINYLPSSISSVLGGNSALNGYNFIDELIIRFVNQISVEFPIAYQYLSTTDELSRSLIVGSLFTIPLTGISIFLEKSGFIKYFDKIFDFTDALANSLNNSALKRSTQDSIEDIYNKFERGFSAVFQAKSITLITAVISTFALDLLCQEVASSIYSDLAHKCSIGFYEKAVFNNCFQTESGVNATISMVAGAAFIGITRFLDDFKIFSKSYEILNSDIRDIGNRIFDYISLDSHERIKINSFNDSLSDSLIIIESIKKSATNSSEKNSDKFMASLVLDLLSDAMKASANKKTASKDYTAITAEEIEVEMADLIKSSHYYAKFSENNPPTSLLNKAFEISSSVCGLSFDKTKLSYAFPQKKEEWEPPLKTK